MKKVLINVEERELRVAILEDEQLVELYIESLDDKSILNNIYKGRVEDVLPGLKAAFVNIGLDRNAFLHFDDVRPDLLWGKYRELHPELAEDVPTAREALAEPVEVEHEELDEENGDRRKRRRGRRGGKKRRPDAEETYSPGLPVGVTEDDLDDEDDDAEVAAAPAQTAAVSASYDSDEDDVQESVAAASANASAEQAGADGESAEETDQAANRRLTRQERQRQRRERWEQRKLERQQRRQQERLEQGDAPDALAAHAVTEDVEEIHHADDSHELDAPVLMPSRHDQAYQHAGVPVYGTRAAAQAFDEYSQNQMTPNQRRQNKARYGDNFGNIALPSQRKHDHRESQLDFFGPAVAATEEEYSVWDERQPNLGPVPGLGKQFLDIGNGRKKTRRPMQHTQRHQQDGGSGDGGGQGQNRNRKNNGGKRRGGKKRTMRKRESRSYFAFSADDIVDETLLVTEQAAEETAPAKPTRRRKTAAAEGAEAEEKPKKTTARKPAAKKTVAAKTTRSKAAAADAEAELPLDFATGAEQDGTVETEEKPKRTRRTTTTRKKAVKAADEPATEVTTAETADAAADAAPEIKAEAASDTQPAAAESAVEASPAPAEDPVKEPETEPTPEPTEPTEPTPQEAPGTEESPDPIKAPAEEPKPVMEVTPDSAPAPEIPAEPVADAPLAVEAPPAAAPAQVADAPASPQKPSPEAASGNGRTTAVAVVPQPASQQQSHGDKGRDSRRRLRKPQFQEVFRKGDEIMVQVVKEEIGMKGARISSYVSLPGRYLVLLPYPNQEGGISRKVEDIKERKRLKTLLRDISSDETAFIVRTAGVFQDEQEIRNDVEFLSHEWNTIAEKYKKCDAKSLVYDDHDILYRLARDVFDDQVSEILIDSHVESEKLKGILQKLIPNLVDKVKLYSGAENIFHRFGVNKQIQKAARRKVWLKSGGYLIIDEAEALTAIDVNTGKSVGKDDQEKLILRTNLEAARAVARELKLRDIGGLIVIDFIDMKDTRNKDQVLHELKLQLRKDRSKTSVSAISEFGLVEMTRKRVRRSLRKTIFMDCPYCQGAGAVLNEQQIWLHIKHEMVRQLESAKPAPTLNITVNPKIRAYVDQNYREVLRRLEQKYDTEIRFIMSDIFHIENYQIEKLETTGVITGSATMPDR